MPTPNLFYTVTGEPEGQPLVLLHGMAASGRYWQALLANLPANYYIITIDLLGFGRSPMPSGSDYSYTSQLAAITATMRTAGATKPAIVIGHSMGALIGLRLAAEEPALVKRLLLCGLPYYADAAASRRDITKSTKIRQLAYYGRSSQLLCTLWCRWLRPFSRLVAPWYLRRLPRSVAQDSLLHTWRSYSQSLSNIIEQQNIGADLARVTAPIQFLYGADDTGAGRLRQSQLIDTYKNCRLVVAPNCGHQLPIEQPHYLANLLNNE